MQNGSFSENLNPECLNAASSAHDYRADQVSFKIGGGHVQSGACVGFFRPNGMDSLRP